MQLVINTFGASLRKQGEQFVVTAGNKKLALSAHKVQSILVTTSVHLTDARNACSRNTSQAPLTPTSDSTGNRGLSDCRRPCLSLLVPTAWMGSLPLPCRDRCRRVTSGQLQLS